MKDELLKEITSKYHIYKNLYSLNRLDSKRHFEHCKLESHRPCGAIWGHTSLLMDIISRIAWWFTGTEILYSNISKKPTLDSIYAFIQKGRARFDGDMSEISDEEYKWLLKTIERCKLYVHSKK